MTLYEERRKLLRHKASPVLTFQLSLSEGERHARGIDHSDGGLSFENGSQIKPGAVIYLWRNGCPPGCLAGEICRGCRLTTLATVRWCRKIKTRATEVYRIGAKYFEF